MKSEMTELVAQLEAIESSAELDAWKETHESSSDLVRSIWERQQDLLTADPKAALRLAEWMISIALDLDEPSMKAMALRAKGNALVSLDAYTQGIEYFENALKIFAEAADELEIARTMMNRVVAYMRLSRFDEALADADRVTEMFQKLGDERRLGVHLVNVGNIYFRLDRFTDHLETLDRAEAILSRINDAKSLCRVYVNRAVVLTTVVVTSAVLPLRAGPATGCR